MVVFLISNQRGLTLLSVVDSLLHLDLHRAMTFYTLPFTDNAISEGEKDQQHMEMLQYELLS